LAGDAVGEHDVEREQDRVGEGERHPQRLAGELDVGEQVDPGHGEHQGANVARRTRAERGEHDDREELDRGDGAERQAVDGQVEAAVHHRQHHAPREQQPAAQEAPGTPPGREDQRRRRDAQPGHAEGLDAGEQQDGERRAEVVEDGAADEVRGGRHRHDSMPGDLPSQQI
jgi:hypothetical protein